MRTVRDRTLKLFETYSESRSHSFSQGSSVIAQSWTAAASSRRRSRAAVSAADSIFSSPPTTTWRSVADAQPYGGNVLGMVMAGKRKTVLVPILHHIFTCLTVFLNKRNLKLTPDMRTGFMIDRLREKKIYSSEDKLVCFLFFFN